MPAVVSAVALTAIAVTVLALVALVVLFRSTWRVAEPNEALIISGRRRRHSALEESLSFKIVTGRGTLVIPGVEAVRRLSLDLRETDLQIDCVTHQGIPLRVRGVVIYKVGDDLASVANAARRFLDQQNQMDQRVHNLFTGHLRAIIGNMTVEEMIRDREKLTQLTRDLALPHAAAVEREARIARAQADREATEKEQQAEALKALARRDSLIKQAGYQAEIDRASAQAQQAGPLSEAVARQQVVVEDTRVVELESERKEKQLQVEVRKPADARAYEQVTLARASREAHIHEAEARAREVELQASADAARVKLAAAAAAERVKLEADAEAAQTRMMGEADAAATQARGRAEGDAIRARGIADADTIKARGDALADNQEAIIGQQLAENWPQIVEAAAKPFGDIDQLIVLNGAQGISDALAQALSQGAAGLHLARRLLTDPRPAGPANGAAGSGSHDVVQTTEEVASRSETDRV